jgi:transcriptional antiterminator RfaH
MNPRWYVIHCEPHHDRQVERLVTLNGAETFAPRIPCTRKRNGDKPLFPGYVFARLDLPSGIWGRLRHLAGVRSLVEIGGGPAPVDDGIVALIRRKTDAWTVDPIRLEPGDRVRVLSGSFADLEGLFCETLSGDQRVAILIDMMRREVRVELSADQVERVNQGVAA